MELRVRDIWFWQDDLSTHLTALAEAVAKCDYRVTYIARRNIAPERTDLGWEVPRMAGVRSEMAPDSAEVERLVGAAPPDSVHLCPGIRPIGLNRDVQRALMRRGLRWWIIMETVDDTGFTGFLKRLEYRRQFWLNRHLLDGVLAIGQRTRSWIMERGMPSDAVYPFAYFLADTCVPQHFEPQPRPFRFIFVGQLIERKRLEMLGAALQRLLDTEFELNVVGAGPDERRLRGMLEAYLPGRLRWLGLCGPAAVGKAIQESDCLVLPSRHDGWGAVISEAIIRGTPVVCSDACGAAAVVLASGFGGVFSRDDEDRLRALLLHQLRLGQVAGKRRRQLASWGEALGARSGADYLLSVVASRAARRQPPPAPWQAPNTAADAEPRAEMATDRPTVTA